MGSDICCVYKPISSEKLKVIPSRRSRPAEIKTTQLPQLGQSSSISESPIFQRRQSPMDLTPLNLKKQLSFTSYINQRELNISSIKKISQSRQQRCSQQKNIFNYLQRLSKEILEIKKQTDRKAMQGLINRNQKPHFDEQRFIEHASTCPVCYELYENLKNLQVEESLKTELMSQCKPKSMRDSLLENQHLDLGSTQDSDHKYFTTMITPQQAKRSMKKFPNVNKCQSKRLRFRKTSNFEPQIKEQMQSDESISTKEV